MLACAHLPLKSQLQFLQICLRPDPIFTMSATSSFPSLTCKALETLHTPSLGNNRWADVETDHESTGSDKTNAGATEAAYELQTTLTGAGGHAIHPDDSLTSTHVADDNACDEVQRQSEGDAGVQTLMLKNLPAHCFEERLGLELERVGFGHLYNYIHVPRDARYRRNRGIGFVNFTSAAAAKTFQTMCPVASSRASAAIALVNIKMMSKS